MLETFIHRITPDYNNLKYRTVFSILFAVSFFIRLPFFFRDYIDRDESTFILMGQSWVEGHLPYTELWDLKPPITYLFFAVLISFFGKSFIAIRFFGALIVAITAFFTYKITKTSTSKKTGFWAAIACVALLSMFGSLQGVMSEHICMVFFMPGLYLLVRNKKIYGYALAGILMGLSIMTKLNIAYVVLFLGFYMLYIHFRERAYTKGILNVIVFGFGILTVILLTFIPYYIEESSEIWWKSIVLASLEYTGARRYSILNFAPICIVLASFFYLGWKKKYLDYKSPTVQILIVTIVGIVFSFLKGGRINGHYLIQFHPVFIILAAMVISKVSYISKLNYRPYLFFILLLVPVETYIEYVNVVKNKIERGTFFNGEGITVPKYIQENNISTENILFLGYHIGYWSLGAKPPVKSATHPSNIFRDELFPFYGNPRKTGLEEIRFIMEKVQPKTIVIRKNRSIFDKKLIEGNEYINAYLAQHYTAIQTVDKAEIYLRLEGL